MERNQILRAFGERVRSLRLLNKLSQEDLALKCQLDRTYISGIERGLRNPSLTGIYKIAKGLEVDVGVLLNEVVFE